jgi:hypothetical protein
MHQNETDEESNPFPQILEVLRGLEAIRRQQAQSQNPPPLSPIAQAFLQAQRKVLDKQRANP